MMLEEFLRECEQGISGDGVDITLLDLRPWRRTQDIPMTSESNEETK